MATYFWANIVSGNGLFAWRPQAIPEPILINHKWSLVAITRGQLHIKNARHYIPDVSLTVTKLVLLPHISGINELNLSMQSLLIGHVFAELSKTNTIRPRQKGCRFAGDIFKSIFLVWWFFIFEFVFKLHWRLFPWVQSIYTGIVLDIGLAPNGWQVLSETWLVSLLTHICFIRLRWVNTLRSSKMAAIFQTTFSNAFHWMNMYELWLICHGISFLGVQLAIFHHWFR